MLDCRKVNNEKRISLTFRLCTHPRSQAIHGSLVETFGPYPQYYTRIIFNFYRHIVSPQIQPVNKKTYFFNKIKVNVR